MRPMTMGFSEVIGFARWSGKELPPEASKPTGTEKRPASRSRPGAPGADYRFLRRRRSPRYQVNGPAPVLTLGAPAPRCTR